MIERYSPPDMAPPFTRYSQGVEIPAGARNIHVAGQVGVRPDGGISDDMAEQTEQAFRNIETVLRARGLGLEDLVETRTYMVSKDDLPGYRSGRAAAFAECAETPLPAAALLFVRGLAQPHWKVEICSVAAKI